MSVALLAAACGKDSSTTKKDGDSEDEPEVFVANALSINGEASVTYETGNLSTVLSGKSVTSLEWTDISQMNATDVMALRQVKSTVKTIDMFKLRFIDDGVSTYAGYSSNAEKIKPELLPQELLDGFKVLESVVLPKNVIGIGSCALHGCSKLVSCTLPPKLEYMQRYCFSYCSSLESIELPETFKEMRDSDNFSYCKALKSFSFPDATVSVGPTTFDGCSSLKSLHLGASCRAVGDYFPGACYALETITLSSNNKNMALQNGCLTTADKTKLLLQPFASTDNHLLVRAFPIIGMRIVLCPYSTIEFENGCEEIRTLFVGNSQTSKIIFPASVSSITTNTCLNNPGVTTLIFRSSTPPSIPANFFAGFGNLTEILVPSSAVNTYKAAAGWDSYASKITYE